MGKPLIDLVGRRFGRLLVESRSANIRSEAAWLCKCDCGGSVIVRGYSLRNGDSPSCGCISRERIAEIGRARTVYEDASDKIAARRRSQEKYSKRAIDEMKRSYVAALLKMKVSDVPSSLAALKRTQLGLVRLGRQMKDAIDETEQQR